MILLQRTDASALPDLEKYRGFTLFKKKKAKQVSVYNLRRKGANCVIFQAPSLVFIKKGEAARRTT